MTMLLRDQDISVDREAYKPPESSRSDVGNSQCINVATSYELLSARIVDSATYRQR
jgi:hypothetical protein